MATVVLNTAREINYLSHASVTSSTLGQIILHIHVRYWEWRRSWICWRTDIWRRLEKWRWVLLHRGNPQRTSGIGIHQGNDIGWEFNRGRSVKYWNCIKYWTCMSNRHEKRQNDSRDEVHCQNRLDRIHGWFKKIHFQSLTRCKEYRIYSFITGGDVRRTRTKTPRDDRGVVKTPSNTAEWMFIRLRSFQRWAVSGPVSTCFKSLWPVRSELASRNKKGRDSLPTYHGYIMHTMVTLELVNRKRWVSNYIKHKDGIETSILITNSVDIDIEPLLLSK